MIQNRMKSYLLPMTIIFATVCNHAVNAESGTEQLARLGQDLTPLGGEKAGNTDGTISAWTLIPASVIQSHKTGDHYSDPYADDAVLFTIDADNVADYEDKLSEGHKALLKTYPETYKMRVYPSRRNATAPDYIIQATRDNAAATTLVSDGNGVSGSVQGIPFPFPENGQQVIWNHLLRYRGEHVERTVIQAAPTRSGDYTLVKLHEKVTFHYSEQGSTLENLDNMIAYFKQEVLSPPRLAGGILLIHETLNQTEEFRSAWLYNPGQRRVRRAPNLAFDNPGTASDGMRTSDQLDMFNGSLERYNWELKGKREIYVPYNNFRLQSPEVKYSDILSPLHINQDYPRYELHRVWVVDATLKGDSRHIYKRRTFYIDEDSWQILVVDVYDNRDQLWRVSEGFAVNFYDIPTTWYAMELHTDLQAGRYLVFGMYNESRPYTFVEDFNAAEFTPASLRRDGRR